MCVVGNICGCGGSSVWVWIKGVEANRGKVQMKWKWSLCPLKSAEITGNQMGATHPPLSLQDLAAELSLQILLASTVLNDAKLTSDKNGTNSKIRFWTFSICFT